MHFFDVGANIGQTFADFLTQDKSRDGWKVWCFEPSPRHWEALRREVAARRDRYTVNLCPFGLGATTKIGLFYEKEDPRGDSFQQNFVVPNVTDACPVYGVQVDIVDFITRHIPAGEPIELKLDCEGAEFDVLDRLLQAPEILPRFSTIYIEWHAMGISDAAGTDWNALAAQLISRLEQAKVPLKGWMF